MSNKKDFVHLHLHTDYSLLKGSIQLKPLAKEINKLEMNACAITDYANMFGAISFYKTMIANEIKPILGYEAFVTFGEMSDKSATVKMGERPYYSLVLLAKDYVGYKNLCYLASKAYTSGFHHKPRIDLEILSEKSEGLIGLSSGLKGAVGHFLGQDNFETALENAKIFESIFGKENYFLEVSDHGLERRKET